MTNLIKRVFTHKSKILLTTLFILSLAFSYGCRGDDDGGAPPPPPTDPNTFSIGEATGNVKASIVQSAKVIGDIKIGFSASHEYTAELTSVDDPNETVEDNKITTEDFQVADNVFTAKEGVATKMKKLDSSTEPAKKTITLNFTLKAKDTTLKNSTQTLPVEVKLTHAQKLDDNGIKTLFNTVDRTLPDEYFVGDATEQKTEKFLKINFGVGEYSMDTYTIANSTDKTAMDTIPTTASGGKEPIADIKKNIEYFFQQPRFNAISKLEYVNEDGKDTPTYTVRYNVTFIDEYEITSPKEIKFEFKAAKKSS